MTSILDSKRSESVRRVAAILAFVACFLRTLSGQAASAPSARWVKAPYLAELTDHSVDVRFELDRALEADVELWQGEGEKRGEHAPAARFSSVTLGGLQPDATYRYRVQAGDQTAEGSFRTAPLPGKSKEVRFLVYGDNRTDDAGHEAVVRRMEGRPSDFLVHTGDFVEDGRDAGQWNRFFRIEAPLLKDRCVYAAVGNHELIEEGALAYLRFFGPPPGSAPPQLYRQVRWGPVRFIFLNAMFGSLEASGERAWVEKALEDPGEGGRPPWTIVVLHHGLWSSGPHGPNREAHAAKLDDLFEAKGVDLVLSGHDHIYERGVAGKIPYIVSGGGGAPVYKHLRRLPTAKTLEAARHFLTVTVKSDALTLEAIRADGSHIETCGLVRGRGFTCDEPAASIQDKPAAAAAAPTPKAASTTCGCRVAGSPPGSKSPAAWSCALALLAGVWRRARRERPSERLNRETNTVSSGRCR